MDHAGDRGDVYRDQAELAEHGLPTGLQVFRSSSIRTCGYAMAVFLHPGVEHTHSTHCTVVSLHHDGALGGGLLEPLKTLSGTAPVIILESPAPGAGPFVSRGRFRMRGYALDADHGPLVPGDAAAARPGRLRLLFAEFEYNGSDCIRAVPGLREGSLRALLGSKEAPRPPVAPAELQPPAKRARVIVTVKSSAKPPVQPRAQPPVQPPAQPRARPPVQPAFPTTLEPALEPPQNAVPPRAEAPHQAGASPPLVDAYQEALLTVLIQQSGDPRTAARAILDMFDISLKGL